MQHKLPPSLWVVDVVGLLVVGVLCAVGKVGADTAIAIIVAVLGLGAVSRVRTRSAHDSNEPPDDPTGTAPVTQRPTSRRSRSSIPLGGIAALVYSVGHAVAHARS